MSNSIGGWDPLAPETQEIPKVDDERMAQAKRYYSVFSQGDGKMILEELEYMFLNRRFYNPDTQNTTAETTNLVFKEGQKDVILRIRDFMRIAEDG